MKKSISIIVAVFNGEGTIQKTLDSIRSQKADDVELIIIDGNSTDATRDIVSRNLDIVDHFVSEPDTGIYNAWNKGLAIAKGDWFAFIGADDWYAEGALAAYRRAVASTRPGTELISSRVRYHALYGDPRLIGRCWSWPAFQRHMTIAHVGALHHRALYARLGKYDESYKICADYELLLRARGTLRAEFIDFVTANMGGGGVSNNQLHRTYAENARARASSGGRSRMLTEIERRWDFFRAKLKRRILSLSREP